MEEGDEEELTLEEDGVEPGVRSIEPIARAYR